MTPPRYLTLWLIEGRNELGIARARERRLARAEAAYRGMKRKRRSI